MDTLRVPTRLIQLAVLLVALCMAAAAANAPRGGGTAFAAAPPLEASAPAPATTPRPITSHPLSVEYMRKQGHPGSDIVIERKLAGGSSYDRYIASYKSEGLKIYALLTVPRGRKPAAGWPVVVFNHGYIAPRQYRTTERYVAYVDGFARNGYIVFKPDYRGHGSSEGKADGGYGSPDYTIDVLNALSSVKKYKDADPARIGMWGHSMGGHITLRAMVISKDIKAGVIWGGVVASYPDMMTRWHHAPSSIPSSVQHHGRRWRDDLIAEFGSPDRNPAFWAAISPISFVKDLSGPLQLHHGTADAEVPLEFSQTLYRVAKDAGMPVELYTYKGDNHNISSNLSLAIRRSVAFFDKHVKGS